MGWTIGMGERYRGLDGAVALGMVGAIVGAPLVAAGLVAVVIWARLLDVQGVDWLLIGWVGLAGLWLSLAPAFRSRYLRATYTAVLRGDEARTPTAPVQPERGMALAGGEMFVLARWPKGLGIFLFLAGFLLARLFLMSGIHLSLAELLTWPYSLAVWFHILVAGFFFVTFPNAALFSAYVDRQRIVVDDVGITVKQGWRVRRMRWDAMRGVLRTGAGREKATYTTYSLIAEKRVLRFNIANQTPERDAVGYNVAAGAYRGEVERLLATICQRTGLAVRIERDKLYAWREWTAEDITTLPVVAGEWQPEASFAEQAVAAGETVRLVAQRAWGRIWRNGLIAGVVIEAVLWGLVIHGHAGRGGGTVFQSKYLLLYGMMFSIVAVAGLVAVVIMQLGGAQRRVQAGLAGVVMGDNTKLAWSDIVAWAVDLPAQPGDKAAYYLFTQGKRFGWLEADDARLAGRGVQGDRALAYRERARLLRGYIAARTGLALRELRQG